MEVFSQDVLARLPLAEATWILLRHVLDGGFLEGLFKQHRGTGHEDKISFALLVQLINAALWEHQGSGRQAFLAARRSGQLDVTDQALYGKLAGASGTYRSLPAANYRPTAPTVARCLPRRVAQQRSRFESAGCGWQEA